MKKNQHRISVVFFNIILILSLVTIVNAQSSPVNLKVINIDASSFPEMKVFLSVYDSQGFSISGLDPTSFLLSEDNQSISNFNISPLINVDQPLAFVIIIDTSGSVSGKPLDDSKTAAKNFISALSAKDQVALISFANEVKVIQDFTIDRDLLNTALDEMKAEGNTALYDSVVEATNILKNRSERKVIVLLTDGKESGISKFNFDQVVNETVRWSLPVYPIGFGEVDKNELERLAILTGGFAQINPTSDALSEAFQNVLDNLREQYLVEYTSALVADGLEHDLDIKLNYQEGSFLVSDKFSALPGQVTLSFPDLSDGMQISGQVLFSPNILSPGTVSRLDVSVDGQSLNSVLTPPFEYLWDSRSISPGEHRFEFIATDSAGNSGSTDLILTVVPPVTLTTRIANDQIVTGKVIIDANVEAPAGVAKVETFIDGQLLSELVSSPYEVEWDTAKTSPGFHDIKIIASDLNGNSEEINLRVNVDIQKSTNLIWISSIVLLAAMAIILPLAIRNNKKTKKQKIIPVEPKLTQAVLVEQEGINPGQVWQLTVSETRLGRKKDENDIPLMGLKASRRHAIIQIQEENYILITINPENPTIVNGQPVDEQVILQHGDEICAGESLFIFEKQA